MNPYQKYKNQSVESMSQGELLVLLLNESIKDLKRAELSLQDKQYEKFNTNIDYFQKIIRYLNQTLDMEQPVSHDLQRLYGYLLFNTGRVLAGRERKASEIPEMITIMTDLRDGFAGASKQTTTSHIVEEKRVVV
ncbi:MAG: flagellar protein FliS [Eubacterium sp.]|nr:flagellar protein FliS [Eubacterium sp.]